MTMATRRPLLFAPQLQRNRPGDLPTTPITAAFVPTTCLLRLGTQDVSFDKYQVSAARKMEAYDTEGGAINVRFIEVTRRLETPCPVRSPNTASRPTMCARDS